MTRLRRLWAGFRDWRERRRMRGDITRWASNQPLTGNKIERLEAGLLKCEQVATPLTHKFAPGVYLREIFMPAGTLVIGHRHKTEHFNVVLAGRATVMMDGVVREVVAPCTFTSKPGVRKVLYIHEDMRWATVHPTVETNVERLEEELIVKSESYVNHMQSIQDARRLQLLARKES